MAVQVLADGLALGSAYALLALALVVTYKASGIPNFAQGELGMLAAFVAYTLLGAGWGGASAAAASLLLAFVIGAAQHELLLRRARDRSYLGRIASTLGFMLLVFGFAGWVWGGEQRAFPTMLSPTRGVEFVGVSVSSLSLFTVAVAATMVFGFFAFFRWTKVGLAMRAAQQNPVAARTCGVPVDRYVAATFGLGSVLGAVSAMLIAPLVTLEPTLMWEPLLKGFAAAVVGGMVSPVGAVVGGVALGVAENAVGTYVSLDAKSTLALLVMVAVLLARPAGLFGRAEAGRA